MGLINKILVRSNSYVYYKNNYENLKKKLDTYNSEINNLKKDNSELNLKLIEIKDKNYILQKKLGQYKKPEILDKLIKGYYSDLTICIKSPNPKNGRHWGDYFFALALKKSFQKKGFNVIIHEYEEWYDNSIDVDINIVLRGLRKYEPDFDQINIMWNISHPELVEKEEYELYDLCCIASVKYADILKNTINTMVRPLLQCTDPEVFHQEYHEECSEEILFVGVTRNVYRRIIKDIIQTDRNVSIYGKGWDKFVDDEYIKGQFIPNNELYKYYSSCSILLNDHWDDMVKLDFPSNRLFDALACGAFVISDNIPSANDLFKNCIVTYDDISDLNNKINYYLNHEDERKTKSKIGQDIVLQNHTFDNRVDSIIDYLNELV